MFVHGNSWHGVAVGVALLHVAAVCGLCRLPPHNKLQPALGNVPTTSIVFIPATWPGTSAEPVSRSAAEPELADTPPTLPEPDRAPVAATDPSSGSGVHAPEETTEASFIPSLLPPRVQESRDCSPTVAAPPARSNCATDETTLHESAV